MTITYRNRYSKNNVYLKKEIFNSPVEARLAAEDAINKGAATNVTCHVLKDGVKEPDGNHHFIMVHSSVHDDVLRNLAEEPRIGMSMAEKSALKQKRIR